MPVLDVRDDDPVVQDHSNVDLPAGLAGADDLKIRECVPLGREFFLQGFDAPDLADVDALRVCERYLHASSPKWFGRLGAGCNHSVRDAFANFLPRSSIIFPRSVDGRASPAAAKDVVRHIPSAPDAGWDELPKALVFADELAGDPWLRECLMDALSRDAVAEGGGRP